MQSFSTPMMRQYIEIKEQYADCLLFFRLGDFYELFLDDALLGARVLGITLTKRPRGKDGDIPMAGVPYHSAETYIAKLIRAGYKVAICEQISEPDARSIVERAVVRIITPGTVLNEASLHDKKHNFVMSAAVSEDKIGIAVADVTTGHCTVTELTRDQDTASKVHTELLRFHPSECLVSPSTYNTPELLKLFTKETNCFISAFKDWDLSKKNFRSVIKEHFQLTSLQSIGLEHHPTAAEATAALLAYIDHTQQQLVTHLSLPTYYTAEESVLLDPSTIINLELFSTIRSNTTDGSVLGVLDKTVTAAGARLLHRWLSEPLCNKDAIDSRLTAVEELHTHQLLRKYLRTLLSSVYDIERQLAKLSLRLATAAAVVNISDSLELFIATQAKTAELNAPYWNELKAVDKAEVLRIVTLVHDYLEETVTPDGSAVYKIKSGVSSELDSAREVILNSEEWLAEYEQSLRKKTGISSLKCKSNSVFGYYIEVSNANLSSVPSEFVRKQTLVNAERFTTPELKHHEEIILAAQAKLEVLELEIFNELVAELKTHTELIKKIALELAQLDVIVTFAELAQTNNYCRPIITADDELQIIGGRHPVVEQLIGETFVPNDVRLDRSSQQLIIITGPNMAGKSVFMRQVAVIVLLAHIGCFVPASEASIPLTDRIFVRSGASDSISDGLSTFMVEMVETAHILHNSTDKSLVVMDEIGRGTSTYDGISIAWAIAEHLVSKESARPKVLFATHYHELQALAEKYPDQVKNFQVAVERHKGKPLFLYTVVPGKSSHSFGVAVAELAGIPESVVKNAEKMLKKLEKEVRAPQVSNGEAKHTAVLSQLQSINPNTLTPLQALTLLSELQSELKNVKNS